MNILNEKVITEDGFELDVQIRIPNSDIKKIIIMSHGLTSNMAGRDNQFFKLADSLCENGFKVIQYDFRGHGKSSGIDLDVSLSSLKNDLEMIVNKYISNEEYYLFGFSFGGLTTCKYLFDTNNTNVRKVVLIGPPLDPINSSLLNPNEFCYDEMHNAIETGSLEKDGYVYLSSKDFKFSKLFLDECFKFDYENAIETLSGRTLLLQGKNDKNVDKNYNEKYSKIYNFKYVEFDASHSLWEMFDDAIDIIVNYYNGY